MVNKIKLGIDLRPLQAETQYRGIGKTLLYFLNAFTDQNLDHIDYVFYVNEGSNLPSDLILPKNKRFIKMKPRSAGNIPKLRVIAPRNRAIRPNRSDIDILLQYDFSLGIPKNVPTIAIFYDLIPYLFRKQELALNRPKDIKSKIGGLVHWSYYIKNLKKFENAKHIISISESAKNDLLKFDKKISKEKVTTIYLGPNAPVQTNENISPQIESILKTDYLMYVGGVDYRKNITKLLDTFFDLKKDFPELKLVTVGKEFGLKDELKKVGWHKKLQTHKEFEKDIFWPGFVNQSELDAMYKHAKVYVFPTMYEGFGLPIIEAMQAGCPVISQNNSSIPEVAGDAAVLINDNEPMAPHIKKIINDKKFKEDLVKKGYKQVKKFSWDKNAKETLNIIKAVAKSEGII
jgi:glycosyltransferase involved in cell wall biosynthesis